MSSSSGIIVRKVDQSEADELRTSQEQHLLKSFGAKKHQI